MTLSKSELAKRSREHRRSAFASLKARHRNFKRGQPCPLPRGVVLRFLEIANEEISERNVRLLDGIGEDLVPCFASIVKATGTRLARLRLELGPLVIELALDDTHELFEQRGNVKLTRMVPARAVALSHSTYTWRAPVPADMD